MSARIIARHNWTTEHFTGWRGVIRASDMRDAEILADITGLVADLVEIRPGFYRALVIEN